MSDEHVKYGYCCWRAKWSGLHLPADVEVDPWSEEAAHDTRAHCVAHVTERELTLLRAVNTRADGVIKQLPKKLSEWNCGHDWPYGPNISLMMRVRLLDWAEARGLRQSRKPTCGGACLRWVRLGYCRKYECDEHLAHNARLIDHVSWWRTADEKSWCLVSQPYSKVEWVTEELSRLDLGDDVHVKVREDSWYGHGTVIVEMWGGEVGGAAR